MTPPISATPRRWGVVVGLLLLAFGLRVSTIMYEDISGDDATVALMAKHILSGESWPVFFYNQTHMGSLNGVHLVPALAVFGPSAWVVRLNAVAYSLLFPFGLYVLARRLFDEVTARFALLLAAVPPFLLVYWSTVAEPHFETNVFGVFLLLLALAALDAGAGPRYLRALAAFGLTAGLAWWTNFKALEVLIPALLLLWVANPRLPIQRAGGYLGAGFALGSLPVWLFYAVRGGPSPRTAELFGIGWDLSLERLAALTTTVIPTVLGTYYWPPDSPGRRVALLVNIAIYAAAVGWAVVHALRVRRRGTADPRRARGVWLLLLTLVVPLAMLYLAGLLPTFDHETARYVLPVYIPLLLFTAWLLSGLWRRARGMAIVLLAFLVGFNVWTTLQFLWPLHPEEQARRRAHIAAREAMLRYLERQPFEALYVDNHFDSLRWAFWVDRLPVSNFSTEAYPPHATAADAARRVGILINQRDESFEATLRAAGIRWARAETRVGRLYTDFALPLQGYRELAPVGWRATASPHPELAAHAIDRDAGTRWESGAPKRPGMWVQVDLGQVYRVGMLSWLPGGVDDAPVGFRLEASTDGRHWTLLHDVPAYYGPLYWSGDHPVGRLRGGRIEIRFPPREARHLKITHRGEQDPYWWTIRELFVYEATAPPPRLSPDPGRLAGELLQAGIRRVYADAAIGARLHQASQGRLVVPPANFLVDAHGAAPDPDRLARFRPGAEAAIVYPAGSPSAVSIQDTLRAAGVGFALEERHGFHLLSGFAPGPPPGRPLSPEGWRVSASPGAGDPRAVLDGQGETRWTTGAPQAPGAWLEARLADSARLTGLALDLGPFRFDYPRGLTVELSADGVRWTPVAATPVLVGPLRWAGAHLLRDGVDRVLVRFDPVEAQAIRLVQTGQDPLFYWSVAELKLFAL